MLVIAAQTSLAKGFDAPQAQHTKSISTLIGEEVLAKAETALLASPTPLHATTFTRPSTKSKRQDLRIPFRYLNGFLIVDIVINNRLPLSFIFDTGSKHTILTDAELIPLLGQLPEEEIRLVGSDLSVAITGRIMRRTQISVGDVDLENQSLILLDKGVLDLHVLTGESIHGILGVGAFGAYGLRINYQNGIIELLEPETIRKSKKATIIPVRIEKSKVYLDVIADIHPGKSQKLSLLLDTGASLSMLIHTAQADSTLFPPKVVTGTFGYGLGGYLIGYVGRSNRITLGNSALQDIVTHFQITADTSYAADLPVREGIVGNGILDRFTILIDYKRNELHLTPTKKTKKRMEYDRSGMHLVRDGEKLNKIRVQHVVEGSPADLAGIQVGDELTKFGGVPIAFKNLTRIESTLRGRIGKTIRLSVKRDEGVVDLAFELQELI